MKALCVLTQLWCTVAALVVFWRAFNVVHALDWRHRRQPAPAFMLFALGYILLALASAGSLMEVWRDQVPLGYVAWLSASALLILFDRRRRRPVDDPLNPLP